MKIVIIDYGMGNLGSIQRAVAECGTKDVAISADPKELQEADKLILPGVGAFNDGINNLRTSRLDGLLRKLTLQDRTPLLGICLGMQLLATRGHEWGVVDGLDLIPGQVKKLEPLFPEERIPHIGWNEVHYAKNDPLFAKIADGSDFYFVHSYHFIPKDKGDIIGTTPYCGSFVSALRHGTIWGVQFHPEKSSILGFGVLKNFLAYTG